jgi:hypothetical protein
LKKSNKWKKVGKNGKKQKMKTKISTTTTFWQINFLTNAGTEPVEVPVSSTSLLTVNR